MSIHIQPISNHILIVMNLIKMKIHEENEILVAFVDLRAAFDKRKIWK